MTLASSGQDLDTFLMVSGTKESPSDMSVGEAGAAAQNSDDHPTRSGVPSHDKFLLAALLLVAAGWILFRLVMLLVTLD